VIPAKWLVMLALMTIAMFPLSLILGIGMLPVFTALVACCSVGIISLWMSLRWDKKIARLMSILPLCFIPICLYLAQFLAKTAAQEGANYAFLHLDILALQAHLVYPVLAIVLTILVWLKKKKPEMMPVNALSPSAGNIISSLLAWLAILAFWALTGFTLFATQDYFKQYLVKIRIDTENVIESDNSNPIVIAVCAGQLKQAEELLLKIGQKLDQGDIDHLISSCLKKRVGDSRSNKPTPFLADRVAVVLKAILVYEKANAIPIQNGCSQQRSQLLNVIYRNNVSETGLQAFQQLGLPVNCQFKLNDGSSHPAWWSLVYSAPMEVTYDKLIRLEKAGISLSQTDSNGHQFLSSNWNGFDTYADDSAILHLIERGLDTNFTVPETPPLSIEVMRRRFGIRYYDTKTEDFEKLLKRVGEPVLQQLLDVKAERWWGFPTRNDQDKRGAALLDYVDERILKLEAGKK